MSGLRLASLAALLPLCVACQTAFAATGGAGPARAPAGLLPPATRPIEVVVADQETNNLAYLVDELAAATGVVFTVTETTRVQLLGTSTGLAADLTIEPAEAWSWIEGLLFHNGFRLSLTTGRPPHVMAVTSVAGQPGPPTPVRFLQLAPSTDLSLLEEHPALLVCLTVDLPHIDVRQIANSLRVMTVDPSGAQAVVPVGNTTSVILTGNGVQVLDLVRVLRQVDEEQRKALEEARKRLESSGASTTTPPGGPPPGGAAR